MSTHTLQSHPRRYAPRWWGRLRVWQRALLVAVVLGAVAIGAGLIYYGPRIQVAAPSRQAAPAARPTPGPLYPPGVDESYYWGQSRPLSQQP